MRRSLKVLTTSCGIRQADCTSPIEKKLHPKMMTRVQPMSWTELHTILAAKKTPTRLGRLKILGWMETRKPGLPN